MTANAVNITPSNRSIYKTDFVGSSQQLREVCSSLKMVAHPDHVSSMQ